MKKFYQFLAISLATILMITACSLYPAPAPTLTPDPNETVNSDDNPAPSPDNNQNTDDTLIIGESAMIDEVELFMMESFPLQINVKIKGNLPDGCTSIQKITSTLNDNTFNVKVITERPSDKMCTQALVPFEENHSLDVYGLKAGTYKVKVYDLLESFTFEQDNILDNTND